MKGPIVANGGSFFRDAELASWISPDFHTDRWYNTTCNKWKCPADGCGAKTKGKYSVRAEQAYNGDRDWKYGGWVQFAIGFNMGNDQGMSEIINVKLVSGAVSLAAGLSSAALACYML